MLRRLRGEGGRDDASSSPAGESAASAHVVGHRFDARQPYGSSCCSQRTESKEVPSAHPRLHAIPPVARADCNSAPACGRTQSPFPGDPDGRSVIAWGRPARAQHSFLEMHEVVTKVEPGSQGVIGGLPRIGARFAWRDGGSRLGGAVILDVVDDAVRMDADGPAQFILEVHHDRRSRDDVDDRAGYVVISGQVAIGVDEPPGGHRDRLHSPFHGLGNDPSAVLHGSKTDVLDPAAGMHRGGGLRRLGDRIK